MHVDTSNVAKKATGLFGQMVSAGYEVGVFGKVTNDQETILKLMSEEGSATWISSPLDYNSFDSKTYYRDFGNGTVTSESLKNVADIPYGSIYQTAQIGNRTLDWIDDLQSKPEADRKPFFAYIGPHAPHFPAQPAPWHEHAFDDVTIPVTPNYNLSSPDKAQHVRQNPGLSDVAKCWEDQHFRDRWASLLSVDDVIDAVVQKLDEHGLLDSTFIFYSSDHGYKQGQWRIGTSKQHPYETDIRVPLLARGPGIKPGSVFPQLTANLDVTPTIIDLAGITPPNFMDGRSMLPWLVSKDVLVESRQLLATTPWRNQLLHEYMAVGTYYNDHSGIWNDGTAADRCGGNIPTGPSGKVTDCQEETGVGNGTCYFVDSKHSNSWRGLRILNDVENLMYIEYDPAWTWQTSDETGAGLQHYELYDIDSDPYQMSNIYGQADREKRIQLHTALSQYYECKGDADTPSSCRQTDRALPPSSMVV